MIEKTIGHILTEDPPGRIQILKAITGFNLLFIASLIGLTRIAPVQLATYLAHIDILVMVFLIGAALVYDKHYTRMSDRIANFSMVVIYIYAYVVLQGLYSEDLPSPPAGATLPLFVSVAIVIALAAASSFVVRWVAWSDFRLRIGGI